MGHQQSNPRGQHRKNTAHKRADRDISEHRKYHSDNARGKVVNQHLKASRHPPLHELIKLFDAKARERTHNHSCHKHRDLRVAHNRSDHSNSSYHPSTVSSDHTASGRGDQDGN